MSRIESVGTYVPRYRLSAETVREAWGQFHGAGITETAVPGADEDTLTMGYEAASRALAAGSVDPRGVDRLLVATTTPPTEEEAMGPRLVSMLGLGAATQTRQLTGSTRAGVEALVAGTQTDQTTLVVATDAPRGSPDGEHEHAGGAGAFAAVLAPSAPGEIPAHADHVDPHPGTRFRPAGSAETTGLGVTDYDRSAFVETVGQAVDTLDIDPSTADAVALQSPNGKLPYRATGRLGVEADTIQRGTVVHEVGDAGTAGPLLGLATAFADGAERVLVVGYSDGATAAVVEDGGVTHTPTGDTETVDLSYGEYLRMRGEITSGEPDGGGAYVSVPSWKRTLAQRHRLVAGRCPDCDALSFPPEGACQGCHTLVEYDSVELPGTGTVEAVTAIGQGGAPTEFVEQQARSGTYVSAVVALDGPDGEQTVSIPAQVVGVDPDAVDIGDRLTATVRRLYTQEEVTRYGFKMLPAK
ncbi:hydroxymethylglutaryl-CoA synthase [Halovenus aranensis]|uniref:Hydroxymethylglutaryl-CoA synthase n=1 Tax=Halovenus aranensis TaxID=890420 RepID=A0A1G8UWQ4_9EURY|nr:zinc ribbon domain-containing protein [Halovenus aranensis]SDJ58233.1 hydroxymethylglutaryl-CoA synthase [Halovenus aranensis]